MSHELETDENGTTYFADSRKDAWHQLGQQFGRAMTAEELMQQSHLGGWDVRKVPAFALVEQLNENGVTSEHVEIPGKFAVVRTNPSTKLAEPLGGVVGEYYTPIQNETATDMLQAIVDESGAIFETAGSLNGGRNVFVTMKLPETMLIGGVDIVELNIAWLTSHDGTSSQQTIVTPVRIVCANTQRAALRNARSSYKITHTASADRRIAQAREALRLTFRYAEEFQAEAEAMINAQMTKDQFVNLTRLIWEKPAGKGPNEASARKINSHAKREAELVELFVNADTQENIRNTAWAGYQSIVEWIDHVRPVRTGERGSAASARAIRSVLGSNDDKLAAFSKSLAFAKR